MLVSKDEMLVRVSQRVSSKELLVSQPGLPQGTRRAQGLAGIYTNPACMQ